MADDATASVLHPLAANDAGTVRSIAARNGPWATPHQRGREGPPRGCSVSLADAWWCVSLCVGATPAKRMWDAYYAVV